MIRDAVLFASDIDDPEYWRAAFAERHPDLEFRVFPDVGDPSSVTYALVFRIEDEVLRKLPNLKAVFALGAGVDQIIKGKGYPAHVPLFRLVDGGLREQMTEYAIYGVLHWHRNMGAYEAQQRDKDWKMLPAVHPNNRTVGVMGLGVLGSDIAEKLALLGFNVTGWSRSPKTIKGVSCYVGIDERDAFLAQCEILINILPLTKETEGILGRSLFEKLPGGGALIHIGRGGHVVEDDLLEALNNSALSWAMIDVFPTEPLPETSLLWSHDAVFVTPHIAAQPSDDALVAISKSLEMFANGEEPPGRVHIDLGY